MKRLLALALALASLLAGPALAYPIQTVGSQITTQTAVQTVTASSAYASGNAVGGLMTLASATASNGSGGLLQSVIQYTKSAQTASIDVFVFKANPSSSTCTDKTAFSLAAADFDKVIGVAHISDWTSAGTPSVGQSQSLAIPFSLASGTALYACAVTRGTPTYASTSDSEFAFQILQNQ